MGKRTNDEEAGDAMRRYDDASIHHHSPEGQIAREHGAGSCDRSAGKDKKKSATGDDSSAGFWFSATDNAT